MLASPVSPSISLRSNSSNGSSSKANNTYSSPRHPAYLPSASNAQAHSSPSSTHSITSSSVASSNNTTSKYTTTSQVDRVNEVLVDKVLLHCPTALYPHYPPDNGSALKRLIAFLDGEEEQVDERTRQGQQQQQQKRHVQSQSGEEQLYAPLQNAPISSIEAQRLHAQQESDISHYPPSQDPSLHPSTPPQSTRTRSNQQQQQLHVVNEERERTHTPRASSRNGDYSGESSRFHVSNGREGYQAPPLPVQPQQPRQYHEDHQRSYPADIQSRAPSSAAIQQSQPNPSSHHHGEDGHTRHVNTTAAPSQSILLSTQAQLDRLKSEVSHLDELVNLLKGQHIAHPPTIHEPGPSSSYAKHGNVTNPNQGNEAAYDTIHERDAQDHQQEEEAQRIAQEAEYRRRKMMEYDSTPASQSDILSLVRTLDSLVWMRKRPSSSSSASTLPGTGKAGEKVEDPPSKQDTRVDARLRYGKGDRSDNVIFTKGNLDHLTRRVKAWEHIVRSKEEEGRYSFVP